MTCKSCTFGIVFIVWSCQHWLFHAIQFHLKFQMFCHFQLNKLLEKMCKCYLNPVTGFDKINVWPRKEIELELHKTFFCERCKNSNEGNSHQVVPEGQKTFKRINIQLFWTVLFEISFIYSTTGIYFMLENRMFHNLSVSPLFSDDIVFFFRSIVSHNKIINS